MICCDPKSFALSTITTLAFFISFVSAKPNSTICTMGTPKSISNVFLSRNTCRNSLFTNEKNCFIILMYCRSNSHFSLLSLPVGKILHLYFQHLGSSSAYQVCLRLQFFHQP